MVKLFSLTKKKPVTLYRYEQGTIVDHEWVEGAYTQVVPDIEANVQPMKYYEVLSFPESDRTRHWIKVFTESEIRQMKEGDNGWGPDRFYWDGDLFEVRKVKHWQMGVLDHYCANAVRVELTPDEVVL